MPDSTWAFWLSIREADTLWKLILFSIFELDSGSYLFVIHWIKGWVGSSNSWLNLPIDTAAFGSNKQATDLVSKRVGLVQRWWWINIFKSAFASSEALLN